MTSLGGRDSAYQGVGGESECGTPIFDLSLHPDQF